MTRKQAERERDRLAAERPDSTWIVYEAEPGNWGIAKVPLRPQTPTGARVESKPKPPEPDDTRSAMQRNIGGPYR